jgi:hypothetical protein
MGTTSTVRQYAGIVGAVLLLLGVVGLFFEGYLFGFLNVDIAEDIVHLVTGALMVYVGFAQKDNALARMVVGVLGAIYLLVGILGFVSAKLFGVLQHDYTTADNIVHLLLGILGLVVAYALPRNDTTVTT